MSITRRKASSLLRPWTFVTLAFLIYSFVVIAGNDGDPLVLVTIGTDYAPRELHEHAFSAEGYDGQFVYYIARYPGSAEAYIDEPAYRYQRILLPALAMVVSVGQTTIIPWALLLVNLVALGAGTALLEHLLVGYGVSRWYALGYGFALGVFGSARLTLPEPLAYALALGALVMVRRESWLWAAILLALAGLAKETALLFAGAVVLYLLLQHRWRVAVLVGGVALLPFVIWQAVLFATLGEIGVGSGGAGATGFEIIPFGGLLRILTDSVTLSLDALPYGEVLFIPAERMFSVGVLVLFFVFVLLLLPFAPYPTLWGLRESWLAYRRDAITLPVVLLVVNAGIMLFVPFSTYREPLGILRFVVGLHIAIVLYAASRKSRRALLNSTIYGYTVFLILSWDMGS